MKQLKWIVSIVFLMIGSHAFCQTKLIAHKSHSGKMNTFKTSIYRDNFGLPPQRIDSIVRISKFKIVEISGYPFHSRDTMRIEDNSYLRPYPKVSIDSLKKMRPHIKFVSFEKFE